jgi:hypothetical protein
MNKHKEDNKQHRYRHHTGITNNTNNILGQFIYITRGIQMSLNLHNTLFNKLITIKNKHKQPILEPTQASNTSTMNHEYSIDRPPTALLIPMYKPFPQITAREGLHIDISNVKHN